MVIYKTELEFFIYYLNQLFIKNVHILIYDKFSSKIHIIFKQIERANLPFCDAKFKRKVHLLGILFVF